ncbi:MAG TPA: phosphate ABC transporter permease PstA [Candidatus Spyradocola merdavium]|nr:phosphate ABC transporter permease PstA [Candidatus Spyradocola merdavium]
MRKTVDNLLKALLWVCGGIAVAFLALILIYVITRGIPYINWEFLTTAYRPGLGSNGIRDIIVGTLAMVGLTLVIAVPIGVLAAIYMGEYAKKGKVLTTIRFCVESLAGIPSILYGLFGYTFFAIQLAFGFSLLSSALTLAIMVLPVIIRSTEEALFTVPDSYREGSLALGASKLTTLFRVILPSAIPGILSAIILSMGRVMGETAAVYYTAGTMARVPSSVFSSTRSLAVHLYLLVKEGLESGDAFATATILIVIVVGLNALANFIAKRLSRKLTGGN